MMKVYKSRQSSTKKQNPNAGSYTMNNNTKQSSADISDIALAMQGSSGSRVTKL